MTDNVTSLCYLPEHIQLAHSMYSDSQIFSLSAHGALTGSATPLQKAINRRYQSPAQ